MSKWPRLSETLTGNPIDVEICQACGDTVMTANITRWVECDDRDQKTRVVVCLCGPCGDKLIEPHPRLYHQLDSLAAWPGTEAVCQGCALRDGVECTSPEAMVNGGDGVLLGPGKPTRVHLSCQPRSRGRTIWMWPKPLTECSGWSDTPLDNPCRDGEGHVSHDYVGDKCLRCGKVSVDRLNSSVWRYNSRPRGKSCPTTSRIFPRLN